MVVVVEECGDSSGVWRGFSNTPRLKLEIVVVVMVEVGVAGVW